MSLSRDQMLIEMGISPLWVLRETGMQLRSPVDKVEAAASAVVEKVAAPLAESRSMSVAQAPAAPSAMLAEAANGASAAVDTMNWPELQQQVAACRACPLGEQRKQAVFGVGDLHPDWLFIGEGPGAEEDTQGEPFVGQAGQLLDNMLAALDIGRSHKVYIANAVKCRPPGNRTPEAAEVAACRPYLARQIALLKPKIIVLLGKVAAHSLLHEDKTLAAMRGMRFEFAGIPVVVTYHPAYLLRNLPDKAKAWEDLVFARRMLREQPMSSLAF